ncbi:hypothetical protein [Streptacidiphilus jiangxiensis]|uniref:GNAT family N-acetyltransferase n=1 Tax=Streptacidiphilus jiangxiensis TaxID=235985 RepID=A0A1H7ZPW2_STRJI|nr:hypothetical protein [Streptacidiphilus jiangxiensis]SEM59904.1 hypothetical protein SAMN05414137_13650 [Streptacidiphilus jiangxiensis]
MTAPTAAGSGGQAVAADAATAPAIPVTATVVESLDDVDATEWDRIAVDAGLYLSHRWLRHEENSPAVTARYVLLTGPTGRLLAATPVYRVHNELNAGYRPHERLAGVTEAARLVIAGARRGYRNAPLLDPSLTQGERTTCLRLLGDCVSGVADGFGADQAWWLYVQDEVVEELRGATGVATAHLQKLDAAIDLPGDDFEAYLAALPRKRRSVVRTEERRFAEAGYELRQLPLSACWSQAGELLARLQDKYGHAPDPEPLRRLLREQAAGLGDTGTVRACYVDDDRMVGFSLAYDFAGTTWIRAAGFDYPRLLGAQEYFSLAFYQPIRDAYRDGRVRRVHLGASSAQAKALRGARLTPLWAVPNSPTHQAEPAQVRSANQRLADSWRSELGSHAPELTF